jgi:outer membrane protein TolC
VSLTPNQAALESAERVLRLRREARRLARERFDAALRVMLEAIHEQARAEAEVDRCKRLHLP